MKMEFTAKNVLDTARSRCGHSVSSDLIDEAMQCESFKAAVEMIIKDSEYWESE